MRAMGVEYIHILIPGPGFIDQRFDAAGAAAVLGVLRDEGWVDTTKPASGISIDESGVKNGALRWDALEQGVRSLAPSGRPLIARADGLAGPSEAWSDDVEELRPEDVVDLRVISGDTLGVVRCGAPPDRGAFMRVICPACGLDPARESSELLGEWRVEARHLGLSQRERWLPEACRCAEPLDPSRVVAETRSPVLGERIRVVAPFARFAIQWEVARSGAPRLLPRVPAALTGALWRATGVAFRSLGLVI
jgi:hypothetical protein